MKYGIKAFFVIGMFSFSMTHAATLIVVNGSTQRPQRPKDVAIVWKEGSNFKGSGYRSVMGETTLSSPWNTEIVEVLWREVPNPTSAAVYYSYHLYVAPKWAPWQKDKVLIIGDNGVIQFGEVGGTFKFGQAMKKQDEDAFKQEFGDDWGFVR